MDPATGRFDSRDPFEGVLWDPPSLHRYAYANLDPIGKIDPSGEKSVTADLNEYLITAFIIALLATTLVAPKIAIKARY